MTGQPEPLPEAVPEVPPEVPTATSPAGDEVVAPVVRARHRAAVEQPGGDDPTGTGGRRRGRWLAAAGALALLGLVAGAAAFVFPQETAVADGAGPDLVASTPVLSVRRAPEVLARPVAARTLQAAVAPVLARFPAESCVEVNDGTTALVAQQDSVALAPASNMKLLTGAAALDVLGPDTRLTTRFAAAAAPVAGTVAGDLFVVGGGDPLLTTDTYAARQTNGVPPATDLEAVADQLVAAGVTRITGSVVGDGTRYDDQRVVASWPDRFVGQGVVGNLGGLLANDAWTVDPVTPGGPTGAPAPDPAAHAAAVLTALLQARGVQVDGVPRSGTAPAGAVTVLDVPSLTVAELVGETLAFSDNTSAELLLKEMGRASGGAGSTQAGTAVVQQWLEANKLPTEGVVLVDGSGLSDQNRVTCALLGDVLRASGPDGTLAQGLARPGRAGTLEDRLTGDDLRDRVRAKTGTLRNVTALSGWLDTVPGRRLQFAMLANTGGREVQAADTAVQGDLLRALLAYPQTPPPEQLVPTAPVAPAGGD